MSVEIKICGIRDPDIAKAAVALGARYIGIVCYEGSKRHVTVELGTRIAKSTKEAGGIPVLVSVDANAKQMLQLCEAMNIDVVQLAGDVSRQSHQQLPKQIQRIYVLHVDESGLIQDDIDDGFDELDFSRDRILFDGIESGSGRRFDVNAFMNPYSVPFFLAGGLTPENVVDVVRTVQPNAVDVSTGVESAPGVKDIRKIKAFIEAVKEAEA